MKPPKYVLVVNYLLSDVIASAGKLRGVPGFENLELLLFTQRDDMQDAFDNSDVPLSIIRCDFSDEADLTRRLKPYIANISGVVCRGERNIQYLRKLLPLLPQKVLASTPETLEAATSKRLMRAAFKRHFPKITPQFLEVDAADKATIDRIEAHLAYPVIIKPSGVFSSILVNACGTRKELIRSLRQVFRQLPSLQRQKELAGPPQVLVEEYLEGEFYSIDAYVMEPGNVYCCPPLRYIPAKQLGIDDFFIYKRFMPTALTRKQIDTANDTVRKALVAVGLAHSSAHVELVRTKRGWKVIEVGPRLGRFRHVMYGLAYGIDHSLNDLKIHLGLPPHIPTRLMQHCSAYAIYPTHEGKLRRIAGLAELQSQPGIFALKEFARPGQRCRFAKHGGAALAQFIIAHKDANTHQQALAWIERNVYADIEKR